MRVKIVKIRQNKPPTFRNLVPYLVYAELLSCEDEHLIISATLDYILQAIILRKFILDSVNEMETLG